MFINIYHYIDLEIGNVDYVFIFTDIDMVILEINSGSMFISIIFKKLILLLLIYLSCTFWILLIYLRTDSVCGYPTSSARGKPSRLVCHGGSPFPDFLDLDLFFLNNTRFRINNKLVFYSSYTEKH